MKILGNKQRTRKLEFVKKAESWYNRPSKELGNIILLPLRHSISPKIQTSKIYGVKSFVRKSNSLLFFSNFLVILSSSKVGPEIVRLLTI